MPQESSGDVEFFAEVTRVLYGRQAVEAHFYSLARPIPPGLLTAVTAWLRTQPAGIGEAELTARANAWYVASEWFEGESDPPAS